MTEKKRIRWNWVRSGYCCMCGECCNKHNFLDAPSWRDNTDIQLDKEGYCRWFDRDTRLCLIQKTKPLSCVRFPSHPTDIESFPNCTFKFDKIYESENDDK